jgi:predicted NUDIX family NTP pyrophosphohydrolase
MLLPNGAKAIIDIRKLRDYCLNPDNPRGSGKARVFSSAFGLTAAQAEFLREKLLDAAQLQEAVLGELDMHGQRYIVDFEMTTEVGTAFVRSGWIVRHSESAPRLTTCYVLKRKRHEEK